MFAFQHKQKIKKQNLINILQNFMSLRSNKRNQITSTHGGLILEWVHVTSSQTNKQSYYMGNIAIINLSELERFIFYLFLYKYSRIKLIHVQFLNITGKKIKWKIVINKIITHIAANNARKNTIIFVSQSIVDLNNIVRLDIKIYDNNCKILKIWRIQFLNKKIL